jgi:hypothetical protein
MECVAFYESSESSESKRTETMINLLDQTIKTLLKEELSHLENLTICFDTPDNDFSPERPAVDLFLYDVRENLELRSNEWLTDWNNTTAITTPPPVRVDCSYLVTAWGRRDAENEEHQLLGEVMKALLRNPTIPAEALQDKLQAQELPLPTCALQTGYLQSLGEFWQALGGKPKAALHYTVTISVDPFAAIETPLVFEKTIAIQHRK